jgi:hypothetical protein
MKKYIALFLLLSSNLYGQQSWRLGFKGAFEMRGTPSSLGYFGEVQGTRSLPSYGIGLFVQKHIWRKWSIIAEPTFHDVGSGKFKEMSSSLPPHQLISSNYTNVRYSAILIPIGLNCKIGLKTTLEAGIAPTFLISGKQTQTIYNSVSKIAPHVIKEDILDKFYQNRFNFPFFIGMNYAITPKIELGLRIYGGSPYYHELEVPFNYAKSNHNTGLALGIRYNFLKISGDKLKDAHYKSVNDRF